MWLLGHTIHDVIGFVNKIIKKFFQKCHEKMIFSKATNRRDFRSNLISTFSCLFIVAFLLTIRSDFFNNFSATL